MPAARRTSASGLSPLGAARRQCPHCERTFNRTEHLERHVRAHTRERPFRCQECAKCYSRRDTLLRHQRNHVGTTSNQPEDLESSPDDINVATKRYATGAGTQGREISVVTGLSATAPSSYPSDQLHSGSRYDAFQSTSSMHGRTERTPLLSNISVIDDVATSNPGHPLVPSFESPMTDPMESADISFDFDWGQEFPSWLMESTADVQNTFPTFAPGRIQPACSAPIRSGEHYDLASEPNLELEHLWFTRVRASDESQLVSDPATPSEPREEVDENYRQTMRRFLQIRSLDTSLPSPDFINLCIRLYFIRFHPKFPVIHVPTFQPSKKNSMLLLSICSIGSLITGTADGLARGAHIWEILNRAILSKWDHLLTHLTDDRFAVVQAALLGQTFALLSGDPKHLAAAEAYHGTLISLARRSKMFQLSHSGPPQRSLLSDDLDIEWRGWAREEELIRTALGLYLHDAELAHIFHHEPLLRPSRRVLCAASDELFATKHPKDWFSRLHQHDDEVDPPLFVEASKDHNESVTDTSRFDHVSTFTRYAELECISATVLEERLSGRLNESTQRALAIDLVEFHKKYLRLPTRQGTSMLEMDILWHLSFISLCTDFDLLERVIGRDGPQVTNTDWEEVRTWAASLDARRATIHVRLIRQKLEALSIALVPAIHIPRAIFFVAVCCYCAFTFSSAGGTSSLSTFEFPELNLISHGHDAPSSGRLTALETKELLCQLADTLQRLGHWGVARKFGAIIEALLHQTLT